MAKNRRNTNKNRKDQALVKLILAISLFVIFLSVILLKDKMGILGKYISQAIFIVFGLTAYILPFYSLFMFFALNNEKFWAKHKSDISVISLLILSLIMILGTIYNEGGNYNAMVENSYSQALSYSGIGVIFTSIYFIINALIADIGIYILTVLLFFISYFYIFDKSISDFFKNIFYKISNLTKRNDNSKKVKKPESKTREKTIIDRKENNYIENFRNEEIEEDIVPTISYHNASGEKTDIYDDEIFEEEVSSGSQVAIKYDEDYEYIKPPIDLLNKSDTNVSDDESILLKNSEIIKNTLESFGIESEVVNINNGPTVTSYEVKPQIGVKVSKITNLSNDLAMALAAPSIRIEAPIPGKPYVGIEVPNREKDVVTFRSLISNEQFLKEDDDITAVIGRDIFGHPQYAKINAMPHLLIAGATGSGKSVMMNAIIMSIIYKYSPQEVEFIMIDPKMVELKVYSNIPHLRGRKVVTKASEATASLNEAVREMTSRFEKFSEAGSRDIKAYNAKVQEEIDENGESELEKLPYLVVIIDELSDLMMEASKDVENYITRLAQMGRASGVHLIIATQRPSVNVITGIIKANIPSRIAFQVASSVDSRTIIDMAGAEKLLGKGDMLYYPSKLPKPKRVQGAFVTDHEIERVVTYVKNKNIVEETNDSFNKKIEEVNKSNDALDEVDELFDDAVRFVIMEDTASISAIQRRFRVGYARAGRIIDQMTLSGIVSEQDGSKPRNVLMTLDEYENMLGDGDVKNELS